VSAGDQMTCAIANSDGSAQGQLSCWGNAAQLDPNASGVDAQVAINGDTTWTSVRIGHATSCGVDGGKVVCWGDADHGGLANGLWGAHKLSAFAAPFVAGITGATAIDVGVSTNKQLLRARVRAGRGSADVLGTERVGRGRHRAASRAPAPVRAKDVASRGSRSPAATTRVRARRRPHGVVLGPERPGPDRGGRPRRG